MSGVGCRVSGAGCQVPGVRCQVPGVRCSGARCQVSGARCQVSGSVAGYLIACQGSHDELIGSKMHQATRHPAPGTRHPAPGTRHPTPGTRHPAPDTRHPKPDTWHPTPDTWHLTPTSADRFVRSRPHQCCRNRVCRCARPRWRSRRNNPLQGLAGSQPRRLSDPVPTQMNNVLAPAA